MLNLKFDCSFSISFLIRNKFHHPTHLVGLPQYCSSHSLDLPSLPSSPKKQNIHILNTLQYIVPSSLTVLTMPPLISIPVGYAVGAVFAVGTIATPRCRI